MSAIRADLAKKSELLALPMLPWADERGWYDALLIIPGRHKHDSGWAHIAIIGVTNVKGEGDMAEFMLAYPDDISWPAQSGLSAAMPNYGALRTDAYYPSGVMRLWSGSFEFSVSSPVSSVDILIRRKQS